MCFKPAVASIIGKKISGVLYLNVSEGRRHSLMLTFDDSTHIEFYSYANIHGACGAFPGGYETLVASALGHPMEEEIVFATPPPQSVMQA